MRRFAITLAIVFCCLGALGQGKVAFGNDSNHPFELALFGPLPVSPLSNGTYLMAVLYSGTSSDQLWLQTSVVLDAAAMPMEGRMYNKYVNLTSVPGGASAYFQIFIMNAGVVLPGTLAGGSGAEHFVNTTYFGTSGLFTAIPGASIFYAPLVSGGASASTWASGPLVVNGCWSCSPPWFVTNPTNASVTLGSDVTLRASAQTVVYPLSYQWRKDGSRINGGVYDWLTLQHVSLSDSGNYDVVASNANGSTASTVATLTVFLPVMAATLGSPTYDTHNQFQFTVTGTVGTNYVVQVSTNLSATTDWLSLLTNVSPFTFVDTNANSFPQRFYRTYSP